MNYQISDLIVKYENKDLKDIKSSLISEIRELDEIHNNITKHKNIDVYDFSKYRDYAGDFLFFLHQKVTPATIGLKGLSFFLPIIKNLVAKNELEESVLERFK
jgi:hypothetical protein